ncbi:MAG: flagellar hook basal-body protein [Cyanobacteria bacterium SIG30]|nr:flagellar hook basal-body protein [Cyanobacteria bacterium SIG30]
MKNLQGIIRRSTVNSLSQYERVGYMSENMSNFNTNTYKSVSFDDVLNEKGIIQGVERVNFAQGLLRRTDNPLNIGLDGAGFIPVTNKNGEIMYTRDGSFTTNNEGTIVTYAGDIVGGGINIGANYHRLEIRKNGDVYTYQTPTSEGEFKGNIPVVTFANPEGLKEIGGNNYVKTEDSGTPQLADSNHQKIVQYHVEGSNVDLFAEVNNVMRLNTSLLATTSLMSVIDDMYNKAINIRE